MRPPPWLALPPLLAISRCFAGSIAANPRFEPPLLVFGMLNLLMVWQSGNAVWNGRFTMLIEVRKRL